MNERIHALQPYPMVELARRKRELIDRGVRVLDFGTGDPVEPTWSEIIAAMRDAIPEVSQYPTVAGSPELREAFCAWYARRFAVEVDAESEVLPSRGSKEAMFHLPLALVDPSHERDLVVYPEPGYPVMEIGSYYAGAETWTYALNGANAYLMDPERVPDDVLARARIVWINYPHNPTGTDLPESLWKAWVSAREQHGFVLCSDECYVDIYFGARPRSVLEFGREGCLAFHSLSKRSGMTGYRSGMVAGDAALIALYRKCRAAMGQAMPIMEQAASRVAWADDEHVAERRATFAAKREVMRSGLAARGIEVFETSSTFYLWCKAPGGDGAAFCERLLECGIVASPGAFFGDGNAEFFRLALVPSLEGCREACERWPA